MTFSVWRWGIAAAFACLTFGADVHAGPLPFEDGKYTTNPELCFLSEDQLTNAYTDQTGRVLRTISGPQLTDGYELSCSIQTATKVGSRVTFRATCDGEEGETTVDAAYTYISRDAFTLAKTKFARCGSPDSAANYSDGLKANSGEILELWYDANGRCRGGLGDDPRTMGACGSREQYGEMLEARGWCWGEMSEMGAEQFWAPCRANVLR